VAVAAPFPIVIEAFMARRKKVYEGKAKILYEGPEPGTLIQYFKDDSAPTAEEPTPAAVDGKGVLNNRLSEFFMSGLNAIGVPTHFIRRVNMREQMVRMAEILPLEVVVRNFAAGELSTRLGIPEGMALPRPIVEYYYKDERLNSPMVAEEHIVAFGWANQQDLDDMVALALRVNDFMSGVMLGVGIRLADFRLEMGRVWEGEFMRLIVADEITPDSCRLWDLRAAGEREGQPAVDPAPLPDVYTELARRLGVLPSNVTHTTKPTLIN
jgi:phosphoribosylaminoimidazole-succinocarboxamide synthase